MTILRGGFNFEPSSISNLPAGPRASCLRARAARFALRRSHTKVSALSPESTRKGALKRKPNAFFLFTRENMDHAARGGQPSSNTRHVTQRRLARGGAGGSGRRQLQLASTRSSGAAGKAGATSSSDRGGGGNSTPRLGSGSSSRSATKVSPRTS